MREYAGGRPSQSSVARRPSPCTPTLLGTEGVLRCCVCCVVDFCLYAAVLKMERCADLVSVFFGTYGGTLGRSNPCILRYLWWYAGPIWPCILRYLWWYAGPIWSLYSSIFMVIRWADPVSVFFDTYRNILYQSDISGQNAQSASIPLMFFSCRLEASARGRWHRAGLLRRRGDYYLGCGRRRYCGRGCCLSRRRVLALPQCF